MTEVYLYQSNDVKWVSFVPLAAYELNYLPTDVFTYIKLSIHSSRFDIYAQIRFQTYFSSLYYPCTRYSKT